MEDIRSLEFAERNGQSAMGAVYTILFVVILLVTLPLGLVIVANVQNQVPTSGLTTNQTTAFNSIKDSSASTLSFATLVPYILVATAVIGAVVGIILSLRQ